MVDEERKEVGRGMLLCPSLPVLPDLIEPLQPIRWRYECAHCAVREMCFARDVRF